MSRYVYLRLTEMEALEIRAALLYVLELEDGGDGPEGRERRAAERAFSKVEAGLKVAPSRTALLP